ncbi:MAG: glutamine synthetase family protein [Acidimicrobiia bacterium]|nr:glutamine synthetase family protein [Acidimicrobiia bacterium]
MFGSFGEVLEYIEREGIEQIDVKVVDLQGRWRRMTYSAAHVGKRLFEEGTGISLSPYPGYRTIESGDMKVRPDISTGFVDPFHTRPTLAFICDMYDNDGNRYERDPRFVLQKAEQAIADLGLGATALFSPELEFYILDGADYGSSAGSAHYDVESHAVGWGESEQPLYRLTGMAKVGQVDLPLDRFAPIREQMVRRIEAIGIPVKYHHQELGTPGQAEIEVYFDTPVRTADSMMIMRYLIKNTALEYSKIVTFMPKPFEGHAGNGTHFHQYLTDGERSMFYDVAGYGGLSELATNYLCGLLEHTPALMGIGNASTNSYRRFAPNMAAPVKLVFGLGNRSSAVRIPGYAVNEREARVEYRMPDATANPYLIIAAQLMAGIDGVNRKLDPTKQGFGPYDVNIYDLPAEEQAKLRDVPITFEAALAELDADRAFLTGDGVFPDELIDSYLKVKMDAEVAMVHVRPHPYEYELYFDL